MSGRRRPRWSWLAAVGLVALVVAGCGPTSVYSRSDTAGLPSTRQDIEEHEWVLDRSDSSLSVDDENPVTFAVRDDVVWGTAGCNPYRGDFDLDDDDTVDITDIALTRRACEPSTMDAEDEFVAGLEAVDHVSVHDDDDDGDNDRLVLDGDGDDAVRLSFLGYDADERIAGRWEVVSLANGDSVDSLEPGPAPRLEFDANGTLTVDTGCRTTTTSWALDGDVLDLDALDLPDEACARPAAAEQEALLVVALDAARRADVAPGELLLLDEDGALLLVATRAA